MDRGRKVMVWILGFVGMAGVALPLGAGILTLTPENAVVSTLAGSGQPGSKDGPNRTSLFRWPTGIAADRHGNLYVADFSNHQIRKVSRSGVVSTFAGNGLPGHADGIGSEARFHGPDTLALDADGHLYVADADNFRIRKITPQGLVTTIAGNQRPGYADGKGSAAQFVYPTGVTVDRHGNLYIADRGSHSIRKITSDGTVSTLAGDGKPGYSDGPGNQSRFADPITVIVDSLGNLYVADAGNQSIRKITPEGLVTTLAGDGKPGYKDGRGTEARFDWPTGVVLDSEGTLYVSDSNNSRIRRISPAGEVTTLAGAGIPGYSDGPGETARFHFPTGLEVDRNGNLYIADSANNLIRFITPGRQQFVHPGLETGEEEFPDVHG